MAAPSAPSSVDVRVVAEQVAELTGAGYLQRTRQNVVDSDGTLIVFFGELSGGTLETMRFCERFGKPFHLADCGSTDVEAIAADAAAFIRAKAIAVLNVAGPRESSRPGAGECARRIVRSLLASRPEMPRVSPDNGAKS